MLIGVEKYSAAHARLPEREMAVTCSSRHLSGMMTNEEAPVSIDTAASANLDVAVNLSGEPRAATYRRRYRTR